MLFSNTVVIITGGGTGFGKATAKRFLEERAKVVINGRREEVLAEAAKELDGKGTSKCQQTDSVRALARLLLLIQFLYRFLLIL